MEATKHLPDATLYDARPVVLLPPIVLASIAFFAGLGFFVSLVMALAGLTKDRS